MGGCANGNGAKVGGGEDALLLCALESRAEAQPPPTHDRSVASCLRLGFSTPGQVAGDHFGLETCALWFGDCMLGLYHHFAFPFSLEVQLVDAGLRGCGCGRFP